MRGAKMPAFPRRRHADPPPARRAARGIRRERGALWIPSAIMKTFNLRRGRAAQQGFTLLELLVVLLIIALLAGYVGPKLFSQVDRAKVRATQAQMKTLGDALVQYRLDVGSYPSSDQGLQALVKAPQGVSNWYGPYLAKDVPADAWGRPYQLNVPGRGGEAEIVSLGEEGRAGGNGELVYGLWARALAVACLLSTSAASAAPDCCAPASATASIPYCSMPSPARSRRSMPGPSTATATAATTSA